VLDSGLALSPTPPILRRREELKLPKVETVDSEELKKLLKTTNFIEKIHLNGGK
ncbi:unnamed protein product, partial [marine sediment metagenome]